MDDVLVGLRGRKQDVKSQAEGFLGDWGLEILIVPGFPQCWLGSTPPGL